MRKIFLTALMGSAALGLAACDGDADTVEEGDTTIVAEEPAPTVTETTVVNPGDTPSDGSTVSVGPDGVNADVDAGDVRVTTDGDRATVTTD